MSSDKPKVDAKIFSYSWGVGIQSQICAQNNFFNADAVRPGKFISQLNGTMIFAIGATR